jgi:L-asparaginase
LQEVEGETALAFKLRIIYTGGTIGCVGTPLSPMSGSEFADAFEALVLPMIRQKIEGAEVSFSNLEPALDSSNLQPVDWTRVAEKIVGQPGNYESYARADAFLILHGTDTMAWTASALSFLMSEIAAEGSAGSALTRPVIVTGAQLPLFYRERADDELALRTNTDALRNVLGAVTCAHEGVSGVGLYFNDRLMQGNRALKVDASRFDAFASPNHPPLASMGTQLTVHTPAPQTPDDPQALARIQEQLAHVAAHIDEADVVCLPAFPAQFSDNVLARMLEAALASDRVRGLFLQGYGSGNFPSGDPEDATNGAICQLLKKAHDDGVVIVAGTQVIGGTVNSTTYAAGSWLAQAGCIGNGDMTSAATQAKLLILLALRDYQERAWSQAHIETLMQHPIAGEIS